MILLRTLICFLQISCMHACFFLCMHSGLAFLFVHSLVWIDLIDVWQFVVLRLIILGNGNRGFFYWFRDLFFLGFFYFIFFICRIHFMFISYFVCWSLLKRERQQLDVRRCRVFMIFFLILTECVPFPTYEKEWMNEASSVFFCLSSNRFVDILVSYLIWII